MDISVLETSVIIDFKLLLCVDNIYNKCGAKHGKLRLKQ